MAFESLRRDMQKNDSLEHNRIKMRASEIMDRFTQDTLKLHHDLVLEHKTAQLNQTRFIALAVVLLILLLCMFFVIKSMRSGKRLEESRHRVLQLKLEGARNRISPHFVFNVLNNKILHAGTAEADELMGLARLLSANLYLQDLPSLPASQPVNQGILYENLRRDMQKNDSLEHNRIKMRASEIMDRFTQDTLKLHHDLVLEHKTAMSPPSSPIESLRAFLTSTSEPF